MAHLASERCDSQLDEYRFSFERAATAIHVWPIRIEPSDELTARFERMLNADERARAARFRFRHLRQSFVTIRGALRILLGRYLRIDPATVRFQYGALGKPHLPSPAPIHFNLSHSGAVAVLAFSRNCEVGVDVERIRALPDMQLIAERLFCLEEAARFMALPAEQREHAFFLCWTRKEAYVKAAGGGLSVPLDSFEVTLQPGEPAAMLRLGAAPPAEKAWALHNLTLAPDYAAALAYPGAARGISVMPLINASDLITRQSGIGDRGTEA